MNTAPEGGRTPGPPAEAPPRRNVLAGAALALPPLAFPVAVFTATGIPRIPLHPPIPASVLLGI
ncbi:hypothetical protein GCM10027168_69410 [Streptomyces capparidis]